MVIEGARDFYERAVVDFIKHDDANSAADLHFAVLNLTEYGYHPHSDDEQTLLRAHSILLENGVDDDLLLKVRRATGDIKKPFDIGRQGSRVHRHTVHPSQGGDNILLPPIVKLPGTERQIESMEYDPESENMESPRIDMVSEEQELNRDLWNAVMKDGTVEQKEACLDAMFSHRPVSMPIQELTRQSRGSVGEDLFFTPSKMDDHFSDSGHQSESLGIFDSDFDKRHRDGLEKITRSIYGSDSGRFSASKLDQLRREHESRFNSDSAHRREANLGDYVGDYGQSQLKDISMGAWRTLWNSRFSGMPDEKSFLDHIVLRNKGVPEDEIWDLLYDGDGNATELGYKRANRKADPNQQMGFLPYLLGVEALPKSNYGLEDHVPTQRGVVKWFIDGGEGTPPGFEGHKDAAGLFRRLFYERLSQIHHGMTSDGSQAGIEIPYIDSENEQTGEEIDPEKVRPQRWLEFLQMLPADEEKGLREGASLYENLLQGGHLPRVNENGKLSKVANVNEEPELNSELLEGYLKAGHLSRGDYNRVLEQIKNFGSLKSKRFKISDGLAAYDNPWMPLTEGSNLNKETDRRSGPAHVLHHHLGGGGHMMGHMDVMSLIHEMFPNFFTHTTPSGEITFDARTRRGEEGLLDRDIDRIFATGEEFDAIRPYHPSTNGAVLGEDHPDTELNYDRFFGPLSSAVFATEAKDLNLQTLSRVHRHDRNTHTSDPGTAVDVLRHGGLARNRAQFMIEGDGRSAKGLISRNPAHGRKNTHEAKNDMMDQHGDHIHTIMESHGAARDPDRPLSWFKSMMKNPEKFLEMIMQDPSILDGQSGVTGLDKEGRQMLADMGLVESDPAFSDAVALYRYAKNDVTNPFSVNQIAVPGEEGQAIAVQVPKIQEEIRRYLAGETASLPDIPDAHAHLVADDNGEPMVFDSLPQALGDDKLKRLGADAKSFMDLEETYGFTQAMGRPKVEDYLLRDAQTRAQRILGTGDGSEISDAYILSAHPSMVNRTLMNEIAYSPQDLRGVADQSKVQALKAWENDMRRNIETHSDQGELSNRKAVNDRLSYMLRSIASTHDAIGPIARGLLHMAKEQPEIDEMLKDGRGKPILDAILASANEGAQKMNKTARRQMVEKLRSIGYDNEEDLNAIENPTTRPHFSTSRLTAEGVTRSENMQRLRDAYESHITQPVTEGKEREAFNGGHLMRYYAENLYDGDMKDKVVEFIDATMEKDKSPNEMAQDLTNMLTRKGQVREGRERLLNRQSELGKVILALGEIRAIIAHDTRNSGMLDPRLLPPVLTKRQSRGNSVSEAQFKKFIQALPSFLTGKENVLNRDGSMKMRKDGVTPIVRPKPLNMDFTQKEGEGSQFRVKNNRNTSMTIDSDDIRGFKPLSIFNSRGYRRMIGDRATVPLSINYGDGDSAPEIEHVPQGVSRKQWNIHPDILAHHFGNIIYQPSTMDYEESRPMTNAVASNDMAHAGDYITSSFDVLTDHDLLLKEEDRDKGEFLPIKAMHRIFDVEDLIHLRGFTGDWVVSIWPEGERIIVTKKKKKVEARDCEGDEFTLSNSVKEGVRELNDTDEYTLDAVWDGSHLHVVDIVECGDEDMENMPTKDRIRHLRATFESNENVSVPAPVNTRRTDDVGLGGAVDNLLAEPKAEQILLRDADATYMRGEARHPKWVLLSSGKRLDVRILSISGNTARVGVGPIYEDVAQDIGNRAVEYDDKHYMDVGTVQVKDAEEGDHITVTTDSITHNKRKGHDLYRLNGAKQEKESEAGATDSVETMAIMSGDPIDTPHRVRVSKGNVVVNLTGLDMDVIYKADEIGEMWLVHDPDAPHTYAQNLADSQRPYWAASAAILLRSEKERKKDEEKHDEKAHVEVEPLANHNKKPKKVDEDQFFKRGLVAALEMIEHMLKEKTTFTGPKGLGIDYATPGNFNTGGTELVDQSALPDYDPNVRRTPREDPKKRGRKSITINAESGDRAVVESDSKSASINLNNNRD